MAAFFIQTTGMTVGDTAIPLAMVGIRAMLGNLPEGRIASHAHRFALASTALCMGVVCWQALHGGPPALNHYPFEWGECTAADEFLPVAWALTVEMVGKSRAIATGLLANSNQLGAAGGASIGGIVLGDLIGNE